MYQTLNVLTGYLLNNNKVYGLLFVMWVPIQISTMEIRNQHIFIIY